MRKIRVLYMHGGILARGGTETFMMNTLRNIGDDIHIDFLVHGFEKGVYDNEIIELGSKIHYIPIKSKDYFGNKREMTRVIKEGNYDIVHAHLNAMNGPALKIAKKLGVGIRISHSHASEHYTTNPIKMMLNNHAMKSIPKYATDLFSCSKVAGDFLYDGLPYKIWYNAIPTDLFAYDVSTRDRLRKEYSLEDSLVIGHIGRFNFQKNHEQLIRIFNQLLNEYSNAKLVLVGEGELESNVRSQVSKLGINESVIFMGSISNVPEMLSMFDVFLLPSVFEGLPYVLVEAQANGLLVLSSDKIDKETKIIDNFYFIDPSNIDQWVTTFKENYPYNRNFDISVFEKRGFNITSATEKLHDFYIDAYTKLRSRDD